MMKAIKIPINLIMLLISMAGAGQQNNAFITAFTDSVETQFNRHMLLGTNAGIYYEETYFLNPDFLQRLKQINPGIIRIPGGSWSNELYWNGNGVRISEESYIDKEIWDSTKTAGGNPIDVAFNKTRYADGAWDVDYSGYAPGFRISDLEHHLSDFHGFTDVLFLHKFISAMEAETMVTVNMGTGTIEMAVEWVKWVKQREKYLRAPFNVKYWEMGNELDGTWELGHFLPDGSEMDAKEYVRRYKLFASAMKEADAGIKVGGSAASSMELKFVEELIRDDEAPIDFISFHAYPSPNDLQGLSNMIMHGSAIHEAVGKIKSWITEYRPGNEHKIEIAVTEWNIKVEEDLSTVDIRNALWSAAMIGEMAKAGVDIAIQWDLFSTTATGGHGLFNPSGMKLPRSQYWACYLWSHFMGDRLLKTSHEGSQAIRTYVTADESHVSVMLINTSHDENALAGLNIPEVEEAIDGQVVTFSADQYMLYPNSILPSRSTYPETEKITITGKEKIQMAPYTIKIIRYPRTIKP